MNDSLQCGKLNYYAETIITDYSIVGKYELHPARAPGNLFKSISATNAGKLFKLTSSAERPKIILS